MEPLDILAFSFLAFVLILLVVLILYFCVFLCGIDVTEQPQKVNNLKNIPIDLEIGGSSLRSESPLIKQVYCYYFLFVSFLVFRSFHYD